MKILVILLLSFFGSISQAQSQSVMVYSVINIYNLPYTYTDSSPITLPEFRVALTAPNGRVYTCLDRGLGGCNLGLHPIGPGYRLMISNEQIRYDSGPLTLTRPSLPELDFWYSTTFDYSNMVPNNREIPEISNSEWVDIMEAMRVAAVKMVKGQVPDALARYGANTGSGVPVHLRVLVTNPDGGLPVYGDVHVVGNNFDRTIQSSATSGWADFGNIPSGVYTIETSAAGRETGSFTLNVNRNGVVTFRMQSLGNGSSTASFSADQITTPPPPPVVVNKDDLVYDFGASGIWKTIDGVGLTSVLAANPKKIVSADLDGNGKDELVVDFGAGPGLGIWVLWNSANWVPLHSMTANNIVAADVDRNGHKDLVVDFPGYGAFLFMNGATWTQIHNLNPKSIIAADLDGGGDELIMDFEGYGLFVRRNTGSWYPLHSMMSSGMVAGDFDGDGQMDLAVAFQNYGLFIYKPNAGWTFLHPMVPKKMAVGKLNAARGTELILEFDGYGLWFLTGNSWSQIHTLQVTNLTTGDLNGDGKDDVVADFGPGGGIWSWTTTGWSPVVGLSAEQIVPGKLN